MPPFCFLPSAMRWQYSGPRKERAWRPWQFPMDSIHWDKTGINMDGCGDLSTLIFSKSSLHFPSFFLFFPLSHRQALFFLLLGFKCTWMCVLIYTCNVHIQLYIFLNAYNPSSNALRVPLFNIPHTWTICIFKLVDWNLYTSQMCQFMRWGVFPLTSNLRRCENALESSNILSHSFCLLFWLNK